MQERPSPPHMCVTKKNVQVAPWGRGVKVKAAGRGKEALPSEDEREKGDLLIRDIWSQWTESIHYMCVMNTDAVSYQSKTPEKCLETSEQKN